jgi:hypothetical protein
MYMVRFVGHRYQAYFIVWSLAHLVLPSSVPAHVARSLLLWFKRALHCFNHGKAGAYVAPRLDVDVQVEPVNVLSKSAVNSLDTIEI